MVERLELTRSTIELGQLEDFLAEFERQGLLTRSSRQYRDHTRAKALSYFNPIEDIWLFAYGSLLWNPTIYYEETRQAHVFGLHRRFCLKTVLGRGTPERPGLMLALDHGGSCKGVVYRISRDIADKELKIIWDREMVSYSYVARVVRLRTSQGPLKAITFAINRKDEKYAGQMSEIKIANVISSSKGPMGSCRDYLFQTIERLTEHGLEDGHLNRLAKLVKDQP